MLTQGRDKIAHIVPELTDIVHVTTATGGGAVAVQIRIDQMRFALQGFGDAAEFKAVPA